MRRVLIGVVVIVLLGGAFAAWQYKKAVEVREHQARVAALRDHLAFMRKAIQNFHADKGRYPHSLEELVPQYLRKVPVDPMTNAAWRLTTEETVQVSEDFTTSAEQKSQSVVIEVHSSAPGYGDY